MQERELDASRKVKAGGQVWWRNEFARAGSGGCKRGICVVVGVERRVGVAGGRVLVCLADGTVDSGDVGGGSVGVHAWLSDQRGWRRVVGRSTCCTAATEAQPGRRLPGEQRSASRNCPVQGYFGSMPAKRLWVTRPGWRLAGTAVRRVGQKRQRYSDCRALSQLGCRRILRPSGSGSQMSCRNAKADGQALRGRWGVLRWRRRLGARAG